MIRRLQLVAAVGLAKVADVADDVRVWCQERGWDCAEAALGDSLCSLGPDGIGYTGRDRKTILVSEVGITQALRETEER